MRTPVVVVPTLVVVVPRSSATAVLAAAGGGALGALGVGVAATAVEAAAGEYAGAVIIAKGWRTGGVPPGADGGPATETRKGVPPL